MPAPKNIKAKAEQLNKALARVAKLANEIADYAEENGYDQDEFFYMNRLDKPYEFDLDELIESLDAVADGSYQYM